MEEYTIKEIYNDLQESKTNKLKESFKITMAMTGRQTTIKHKSQIQFIDKRYRVYASDAKAKKSEHQAVSGSLVKYAVHY